MLAVKGVQLAFGTQRVLHDIDLDVAAGEIVCLLGASGCGKTSLLRVIAGLERGYTGSVEVNAAPINQMPPEQRHMGMMFQDFALFPHLNVRDNVAFGLKMRGQTDFALVEETLASVGLESYGRRDVATLSGGEKQRVALARSLITSPDILLLDEPLGSLDAGLRVQLMGELRERIKAVGITAIYVTHDQQEAFGVADRVAIMNAGKIEQIGDPQSLFFAPASMFVAHFLGIHNLITVPSGAPQIVTDFGRFDIPTDTIALCVHPNALRLSPDGAFTGEVRAWRFEGEFIRVVLMCGSVLLEWRERSAAYGTLGDTVRFELDRSLVTPLTR